MSLQTSLVALSAAHGRYIAAVNAPPRPGTVKSAAWSTDRSTIVRDIFLSRLPAEWEGVRAIPPTEQDELFGGELAPVEIAADAVLSNLGGYTTEKAEEVAEAINAVWPGSLS